MSFIEITKEDERRCRVLATDIVGVEEAVFEEGVDGKPDITMCRLILAQGVVRWAKFETLHTLCARIEAARGGMPLRVLALAFEDRAIPQVASKRR